MRSRKVIIEEPEEPRAPSIALLHTEEQETANAAPAAAPAAAAPTAAEKKPEEKKEEKEPEKKKTSEPERPTQSRMASRAEHYAQVAQRAASNAEQHLADAKNAFKQTADQAEKAKSVGKKITGTADDVGELYSDEKNRRKRKQRERSQRDKPEKAAAHFLAPRCSALLLLTLAVFGSVATARP